MFLKSSRVCQMHISELKHSTVAISTRQVLEKFTHLRSDDWLPTFPLHRNEEKTEFQKLFQVQFLEPLQHKKLSQIAPLKDKFHPLSNPVVFTCRLSQRAVQWSEQDATSKLRRGSLCKIQIGFQLHHIRVQRSSMFVE